MRLYIPWLQQLTVQNMGLDKWFWLNVLPFVQKQFIKRIDCLEKLLAEERHKVQTAEKKLFVQGNDSLSTAMSDDTKLRMREKEIMQQEVGRILLYQRWSPCRKYPLTQ